MKSAAAALLGGIAATPLARPALWAAVRLGRAGVVPPGLSIRASQILASALGDDARTYMAEVSVDAGRSFHLACDLRYEQYRRLFFGSRSLDNDRLTLDLMKSRMADVDAIFDIGANAGIFAYAAAAAGARRLYAFEPIPRLAALLRANVERNGAGEAVRVHQELVGSEEGTASFFQLSSDVESTMIAQRAADREVVEEMKVPIVRLDAFCAREGIDPCRAFFKIDVEGNEMEALAGLDSVLDRADAPDIVLELLGPSLQQGAIERIAARGYQVHYLAPGGPIRVYSGTDWSPHQDLSCWDFFLTKRGLPQ